MHEDNPTHDNLTDPALPDPSRHAPQRMEVPSSGEHRAATGERQAQAPRMRPIFMQSGLQRTPEAAGASIEEAPRDIPPLRQLSSAPPPEEGVPQNSTPNSHTADETKRRVSYEDLIASFKAVQQARTKMENEIESRFGASEKKAVWNTICAIGKSDARARALFVAHLDKLEEGDAKQMKRLLAYWESCDAA